MEKMKGCPQYYGDTLYGVRLYCRLEEKHEGKCVWPDPCAFCHHPIDAHYHGGLHEHECGGCGCKRSTAVQLIK